MSKKILYRDIFELEKVGYHEKIKSCFIDISKELEQLSGPSGYSLSELDFTELLSEYVDNQLGVVGEDYEIVAFEIIVNHLSVSLDMEKSDNLIEVTALISEIFDSKNFINLEARNVKEGLNQLIDKNNLDISKDLNFEVIR